MGQTICVMSTDTEPPVLQGERWRGTSVDFGAGALYPCAVTLCGGPPRAWLWKRIGWVELTGTDSAAAFAGWAIAECDACDTTIAERDEIYAELLTKREAHEREYLDHCATREQRDAARAELSVEREMHNLTNDALMKAQRAEGEAISILHRELPGAALVDAVRYVVDLVAGRRAEAEQLHAAIEAAEEDRDAAREEVAAFVRSEGDPGLRTVVIDSCPGTYGDEELPCGRRFRHGGQCGPVVS